MSGMKGKLNKYFLFIALLLHLISVMTGSVFAADSSAFDPDYQSCIIKITLAEGSDKTPVVGAEVTVYRVADMSVTSKGFSFNYRSEFAGCGLELDDLEDPSLSKKLLEYANANRVSGISDKTDSVGYVCFEGLNPGLYLVAQTKSVKGFKAFEPFLTYLPVTVGDSWKYEIDATPKVDIEREPVNPPPPPPPPDNPPDNPPGTPDTPTKPSEGTDNRDDPGYRSITVRKVWNDDGENRPSSVTVRLMNANGVYDEVVLSESNGWSYTWYSLDYYENWYVQEANVPTGYTVTYYEDGELYTVVNTMALAQTGQLKWPIPILGGCGVILVIAGFILKSAGRKGMNDK